MVCYASKQNQENHDRVGIRNLLRPNFGCSSRDGFVGLGLQFAALTVDGLSTVSFGDPRLAVFYEDEDCVWVFVVRHTDSGIDMDIRSTARGRKCS